MLTLGDSSKLLGGSPLPTSASRYGPTLSPPTNPPNWVGGSHIKNGTLTFDHPQINIALRKRIACQHKVDGWFIKCTWYTRNDSFYRTPLVRWTLWNSPWAMNCVCSYIRAYLFRAECSLSSFQTLVQHAESISILACRTTWKVHSSFSSFTRELQISLVYIKLRSWIASPKPPIRMKRLWLCFSFPMDRVFGNGTHPSVNQTTSSTSITTTSPTRNPTTLAARKIVSKYNSWPAEIGTTSIAALKFALFAKVCVYI